MNRGRSRLPLAILVAVVAAGAATFLLRPRSGLIEPAAVDVKGYFTAFQLDRAEDYRSVQRLLGIGGLVAGTATLAFLAWRPPRRVFARLSKRPILGGAAAAVGISLLLVLVELPISAVSHARAVDVGLATQDWLPWLGDIAKSAGIDAVFAAAGGALALALIRRFRRNWWAPAAAVIVAFGVVTIWLFPIVIDPLFNRFEPLRPGPTRSDVLELADEAGVDVGEVYRVDASRRTTAANAYVVGLGKTKRVVLYDNLISAFPRDQMRLVVAHELGHQKHNDLTRGLVWLALVAPAGTFLAQALAERFGRREGLRRKPEAGPDRAARDRPVARDCELRPGRRFQRALAPGGGPRGRLLAAADRRPGRVRPAGAPARAAQHLRPRSALGPADAVRHTPDHGASASGSARRSTCRE